MWKIWNIFSAYCKNLTINKKNPLNCKNCINMDYMFFKCDLKDVCFSFIDAKNAESMKYFLAESENITINEKSFLNSKNCLYMDYFFQKCDLKDVCFSFIDARNAESMKYFLAESKNITINGKSFLNSKNCLYMDYFFQKCDLSNVNFTYLETKNVKELNYFFDESINIKINKDSSLYLINCTKINTLFSNYDLSNINLSFINIRNVEIINNCFNECKNIEINYKSNLNTKYCTNIEYMFSKCDLKNVNFSFLYIENVKDIKYLFEECKNISINNNSTLNLKNCINIENLFYDCDLDNVDLSFIDTRNVVNMIKLFEKCINIKINDKSSLNLTNCVKLDEMFCDSDLKNVDISFLDTRNITSMAGFFNGAQNVQINEKKLLNTNKVKNMKYFCSKCDISNIDFSFLNTTNITNMEGFFQEAKNIKNIHLSNLNTKSVTNMKRMFSSCYLKNIKFNSLYTKNVTDMSSMFQVCYFENIDFSGFFTNNVTNMEEMFQGCNSLSDINFSYFNTSKVLSMNRMFFYCNLKNIDISSFDTQSLETMNEIFKGCKQLEIISLPSFNCRRIEMNSMFDSCYSLKLLKYWAERNENYNSITKNKLKLEISNGVKILVELRGEWENKNQNIFLQNNNDYNFKILILL